METPLTAILIVEDDPQLGPLLVTMLRQSGHERVLLANDAPEAIATAMAHRDEIELLISDVGLPSRRGDALAADLAGRLPGIGVLLMSGSPNERKSRVSVPAGWSLLDKPFSREALLAAVAIALENRGKNTPLVVGPPAATVADRAASGSAARPDRETTNESLRVERGNADQEIVDRRSDAQVSADDIVARARDQADAVLDTARGKEDDTATAREARAGEARAGRRWISGRCGGSAPGRAPPGRT